VVLELLHDHPQRAFGENPSRGNGTGMKPLSIQLRCGLGDHVHAAHLLQLYRRRGFDVRVDYPPEMEPVYAAASIPFGQGPRHFWEMPDLVHLPGPNSEIACNMVASQINRPPLPDIGDRAALWKELCETVMLRLEAPKQRLDEAKAYIAQLPRPLFLLHTSGESCHAHKNLPDPLVKELAKRLYDAGSVVSLDGHRRYDCLRWQCDDVRDLAAIYQQADCLIGIDSGPLHFALLTDLPALGVFTGHHPACFTIPRTLATFMVRDCWKTVNAARGKRWRLVEYAGEMPTAGEIARLAIGICNDKR
jgi:hypothetical protein